MKILSKFQIIFLYVCIVVFLGLLCFNYNSLNSIYNLERSGRNLLLSKLQNKESFKNIEEISKKYNEVEKMLKNKGKWQHQKLSSGEKIKLSKQVLSKEEKAWVGAQLEQIEKLSPDNGFINYINAKYYLASEIGVGTISWVPSKYKRNIGYIYEVEPKYLDIYDFNKAFEEIVKGNNKKNFNSQITILSSGRLFMGLNNSSNIIMANVGKKYENAGKKETALKIYKEIHKMGDRFFKEDDNLFDIAIGNSIRSFAVEFIVEYAKKYKDVELFEFAANAKEEGIIKRYLISDLSDKSNKFFNKLVFLMIITIATAVLFFILMIIFILRFKIYERNNKNPKILFNLIISVFIIYLVNSIIFMNYYKEFNRYLDNVAKYGEFKALEKLNY